MPVVGQSSHQLHFKHFSLKTGPLYQLFVSSLPTSPAMEPGLGFAAGLVEAACPAASLPSVPVTLVPAPASGAVSFPSLFLLPFKNIPKFPISQVSSRLSVAATYYFSSLARNSGLILLLPHWYKFRVMLPALPEPQFQPLLH